ncbi:hypothetical protein NKR23_g3221 [Pleurostoma richardsiae]|uniref:Dienelactone hydrolase domain-containing protein n=1 Tax=Pleurostoma richardsiae TaxID=41990 RepID=A0AA38RZN5_9PEZI|nr:hypothetical protein NKR23_g3221 [Pleurostoma richardsiae]
MAAAPRGHHYADEFGATVYVPDFFGSEVISTDILMDRNQAHPTFLEKQEIGSVGVPVQILAPEIDPRFTEELKAFSNQVIPTLGFAYDYQYFPGLEHGFAIRGDPKNAEEKKGMERAENAAVLWFRQWLHED